MPVMLRAAKGSGGGGGQRINKTARRQLGIGRAKKTPAEPGFLVTVSACRLGPTTNPKNRAWAAASSASAFPFLIGNAARAPRQQEESYP